MRHTIGFTGTRGKIADYQERRLLELLLAFHDDGCTEFHHGDCEGADEKAHDIALRIGYRIHIHPPSDPKARAFCHKKPAAPHQYVMYPPAPYLVRNRSIVNHSEIMVATPSGPEVMRSGTWATVRYARQQSKYLYVIYPNSVETERSPYGLPTD